MGPASKKAFSNFPLPRRSTLGGNTHKLPPKPEFLCEQSIFKPKRSDEIPTYPETVRYPDSRVKREMFTHMHIPNKMRSRLSRSSPAISLGEAGRGSAQRMRPVTYVAFTGTIKAERQDGVRFRRGSFVSVCSRGIGLSQ